jgi:Ca-activated chloride channel family protein
VNYLTSFLLAPSSLIFLATIPVVILLYLLKLRRTEVVISSTFLWRRSLQDLTANAPFQRLRKNLLLLLQILVLLLLVLALARPFVEATGTTGNSLCLIIDHSASMQTREGEKTRLELAKRRALEMVDTMERGDRMMLVSFAQKADVLCELTENRHRLRGLIEAIQPRDTLSRISDVLSIVRSLAPDNPDVTTVAPDLELVLLSDGRLTDPDQLGTLSRRIHYVRVGETDRNAGIVRFATRRAQDGLGARQAFALVYNDAPTPLQTTLTLSFEGSVLAVEEISVPPRETRELLFELPELESGLLEAALDVNDALPVDDRAWLSLRPDQRIRVLLVSAPDAMAAHFFRKVLDLDPRVELAQVTPEDFIDTGGNDLIIFNSFAPPALPAGTLLYVNALPPVAGMSQQGELVAPAVIATEKRHPLMRFLNPANLRIAKAMHLDLPDGARSLLSTEAAPLIADLTQGTQQIAVVAFDLADSDWPLQLSFPLFVQNLISWVPIQGGSGEAVVAVGQPIEILPAAGTETATVTTPSGERHTVDLDPLRPAYFGETQAVGPYTVRLGEQEMVVAVNLLDANESAIHPADTLPMGEGEIDAASQDPQRFKKELWPWLIAAGLLIICAEWWLFCYRAQW